MHITSRQLNNYHHQARLNGPEMTTDTCKLHGFKRADNMKHAYYATIRLKHTLDA